MEQPRFRHRCERCGAPSVVGALTCRACGEVWVDDDTLTVARRNAQELVGALGGDPYLRSAGLLGYTLRSHVRGFLDDPVHPLAVRLLRYLHTTMLLGGPGALRHLAPHAERAWIAPHAPVLVRALRYVRERFAKELAEVGMHPQDHADFEAWHRGLERRDALGHSM